MAPQLKEHHPMHAHHPPKIRAATPAGKSLAMPLEEARPKVEGRRSKVDSIEHKISVTDRDIEWFDRKANSSELMAECWSP